MHGAYCPNAWAVDRRLLDHRDNLYGRGKNVRRENLVSCVGIEGYGPPSNERNIWDGARDQHYRGRQHLMNIGPSGIPIRSVRPSSVGLTEETTGHTRQGQQGQQVGGWSGWIKQE